MNIKNNLFVNEIEKSTRSRRNIRTKERHSSIYSVSYIVDISAKGFKYQEEYKDDDYPIYNQDVFSYKKNLELQYK